MCNTMQCNVFFNAMQVWAENAGWQCCVWLWNWGIPSDPKATRKWTAHHRVCIHGSVQLCSTYFSGTLHFWCSVLISVVGIFHYSCAVLRETVSLWMLSGPAPTNIATEIWHHHHCYVAPDFFLAQNILWHEVFIVDNILILFADNWQGGSWIYPYMVVCPVFNNSPWFENVSMTSYWVLHRQLPPEANINSKTFDQ